MAKKGKRPKFALVCEECKQAGKTSRNYVTTRSVVNTPDKLAIKKHCPACKKHTVHKEAKLPNPKKQ